MYIKTVRIRNFKNIFNNIFEFDKNINTIIGENGTGKTNLFQAIRLALDNQFRTYLSEELLSNKIVHQRGHWLIISVEFAEVGSTVEEVHLKPDINGKGILTFIYRPKKDIRTQLHLKSKAIKESSDSVEKDRLIQELTIFMDKIDYRDDYEDKKTVTTIFDFNDDNIYKEIVGDFDLYDFPHPDEHDNKSIIGNPDQNFCSYINVTFIPAIRNVTSELTAENNFLTRILSSLVEDITDDDWINFEDHIMSINEEIGNIKQFTDFVKNVDVITNKTVGNVYATNVELKMQLPDKRRNLIKFFNLKGKEDLNSLSLYNRSLGDNNIIYFALKLVESTMKFGHSEKVFKLMLIEEPEAHIHKFLQESLFSGLRSNTDYQLFLSTHSVHISEASRISSMTILDKRNGTIVAYKPDSHLDEKEVEYLERYLDATKTSVLFSKNVCIVEGTAEILMIPKLYEFIYNMQFASLGLSIHSIDGSFFEGISKLFHENRIQKFASLITDGDKDFENPDSNKEINAKERIRRLFEVHENNDYVEITHSEYTFEIDFYRLNKNVLKRFIVETEIYKTDNIINDFDNEGKVLYSRIMSLCNKVGKGWLAYKFIQWLKTRPENLKELKIPDYIHKAIAFNVVHIFSEKSIDEFIDTLRAYKNSIGNTKDNFINILLEKKNG